MIHLHFRYLHPERVQEVCDWLEEAGTTMRTEAVATLVAEGVRHETAHLVQTSDGVILVYAMETDDIDHARRVGSESTAEVDRRHKQALRAADAGPVPVRQVLDLRAVTEPL